MDTKVFPVYSHVAKRGLSADAAARVRTALQVAPWTAKQARNGNPVLPDEVIEVLREECAKYPGPVQHDEVFAILLNNTACRTAHLGMGLSRKRGGRRVEHPDPRVGEIAEDILQHQNGHHWDVFGGAAVGNPLNPGQGPSIGIINLNDRPWVAPVCDAVVDPGNGNGGEPDQPPPPPPPPPPDNSARFFAAIEQLGHRLDAIERGLAEKMSSQDIHALIGEQLIGVHVADILKRLDRNHEAIGTGGGVSGGCRLPSWARSLPAGSLARAIEDAAKEGDPERPQTAPGDEPR
jgi:hypothetical protein